MTEINHLLNQPLWGAMRGVGTYLYLQFGAPHLKFRDPSPTAHKAESKRVRDDLSSRRVWLKGDWQIWVQDCEWAVTSHGAEATAESPDEEIDSILQHLDGQIVRTVALSLGKSPYKCMLQFDLGGEIHLDWSSASGGDFAFDITSWHTMMTTTYYVDGSVRERSSAWHEFHNSLNR